MNRDKSYLDSNLLLPFQLEAVMNRVLIQTLAGVFFLTTLSTGATAEVTSLRGVNSLDAAAKSFDRKKPMKQEGGFDRGWKLQPPSIPHAIEKDRISLRENTCLKCHSAENHEKENAPKAGDSHFVDREKNELKKVSSRRWFCDQCHTPQLDTSPLVENTFKGVKLVK